MIAASRPERSLTSAEEPTMDDEIELISDGDGLAVIGNPTAVERFLDSVGLLSLSKDLGLDRLGSVLNAGAGVAQTASEIAVNSGRYVRLTKESARLVDEFGLMSTKTPGVSHAMVGKPGSISRWLQIENGPGSFVTDPELLSGAAGITRSPGFSRRSTGNSTTCAARRGTPCWQRWTGPPPPSRRP
jgi:hypothetical protein